MGNAMSCLRAGLFGLALSFAAAGGAAGQAPQGERATAIFAGGCFWCVEADFDKVPGVISTTSGYTGGKVANPTYQQVSAGTTGHTEAVEVVYDPGKVGYAALLDFFWHHIDPLTRDAQFCDHGPQYRSAIFFRDDEQKRLAEASRKAVAAELKKPVFTEIAPAGPFYKAEDYHQDYYLKNPARYKFYRWNCGRDQRISQIWGKKD
jgi:peptide-methionine (S)-S-oxide reductase